MSEYKLANGTIITDADIDQIRKEFESESWTGRLERIHHGPAAIADDDLITVTVKFPKSMVAAIDEQANNRSEFIRKAVASCL
ncbi:MAG: ribbon-helix-helix domain-containing protein [Actinomycetaceae bacterium]|nr:ribbon-helix-helix domain-containing protein [Actinomycetaceae bacterium]